LRNIEEKCNPPNSEASFDKIDVSRVGHWCAYLHLLKYHLRTSFIDIFSINYLNIIPIIGAVFHKPAIFCVGFCVRGSYSLELGCSVSYGTDPGWINSRMQNMNKIRPTVQAPGKGTSTHTPIYMHTH
jgi:hypothetical protein